jgi:hypothetical protein
MRRIVIVSVVLLPLLGCGPKRELGGSVSGKVTYKGQPVNGAVLRLYPADGEGTVVKVSVGQDGTFHGADLSPGEYKIVVEGSQIPPDVMKMPEVAKGMDPAKAEEMKKKFQQSHQESPTIAFPNKYKNPATTDLQCKITKGKQENLNLELKD